MRTLTFQSVAPGDYFEFAADCVLDGDHGVHLEYKCGEHRAELVNRQRIVAFHQHVPAPLAHTDDEKLDLEIGWAPSTGQTPRGFASGRSHTPWANLAGARTS